MIDQFVALCFRKRLVVRLIAILACIFGIYAWSQLAIDATAFPVNVSSPAPGALGHDRRELISRYAADQMTNDEYIAANRALDEKLERLQRTKAKLAAATESAHHEEFVDASVRQFCATAKARLQACSDFDANRQFLMTHVERVIFNRYDVAIVGSVPVRTPSGETGLPFRIEGKIDIASIRSNSCRRGALAAMRADASAAVMSTAEDQSVLLVNAL